MFGNTVKLTFPVVINTCYGGFGLSKEAVRLLNLHKKTNNKDFYNIPRNDLDLIDVVRFLGDKANDDCAELEIVNIEIQVSFDSHDGKETISVSGGEAW